MDTRTEVLVQEAIAPRADRTSFVIAHRLSTIRDADTILVMEDGRIVEHGDHDELPPATVRTTASTTPSSPVRDEEQLADVPAPRELGIPAHFVLGASGADSAPFAASIERSGDQRSATKSQRTR